MLSPIQLELTRLIGKKELTFGCEITLTDGNPHTVDKYDIFTDAGEVYRDRGPEPYLLSKTFEIIGHPATLSDFHRFLYVGGFSFKQYPSQISISKYNFDLDIRYNASKELPDQEESTLEAILDLIKSNQ